MPKPLYTIEVFPSPSGSGWTSHIKHRNGDVIWSSTRQDYSRKVDAMKVARNFVRWCAADDHEIGIEVVEAEEPDPPEPYESHSIPGM